MTLSLEATPVRSLETRTRNVGGTMQIARGAAVFRLSDVAAEIWRLMDGRSVGDIISAIADGYETDPEAPLPDVSELIEQLIAVGAAQADATEYFAALERS
jgi:hypothetical protein